MSNQWKNLGIPHKGWTLIEVIDVREGGQEEWETDYETCMMCGNEKIRFVHIVTHIELGEELRVGCICAEKMTNDYINPKNQENNLRNRASRRKTWLNREWKRSKKGNKYLKFDGHILTIFQDPKSQQFKCKIDEKYGTKTYTDIAKARIGLFNKLEELKRKSEW